MKHIKLLTGLLFISIVTMNCSNNDIKFENADVKIAFLHHSTGKNVWNGKKNTLAKLSNRFQKSAVKEKLNQYCTTSGKKYLIEEIVFPKASPYGWKNYPYDYYNIWVKNAGEQPYMEEPTLEILTKKYNVIVFKHCFPVSNIEPDSGYADVNSEKKTVGNYKLQYDTLKQKLRSFPNTKFIVWTGAAHVQQNTNEEEAKRAETFFNWVVNVWDEPSDNIFIWDFRQVQTNGGLYLPEENAVSSSDSHPNGTFSEKAAGLFVERVIDVIEQNGEKTLLTGEITTTGN